jgi:propane monooxygenase coupling protein
VSALRERRHDRVGISLMAGPDAEAAVAHIRETQPDAVISDRVSFYKIEREGQIGFDMDAISDIAGRRIDTQTFLVSMSTFYGRIDVAQNRVDIYSAIKPPRFQD